MWAIHFHFFFLPLLTVHIKKNIHLNHFISLFIETCYCEILVAQNSIISHSDCLSMISKNYMTKHDVSLEHFPLIKLE